MVIVTSSPLDDFVIYSSPEAWSPMEKVKKDATSFVPKSKEEDPPIGLAKLLLWKPSIFCPYYYEGSTVVVVGAVVVVVVVVVKPIGIIDPRCVTFAALVAEIFPVPP